ncbi:hypothetical protein [Planobispora rosea]|nr:hypothetical protein [Planobispora rosea]
MKISLMRFASPVEEHSPGGEKAQGRSANPAASSTAISAGSRSTRPWR